jgi:hypothetical protein
VHKKKHCPDAPESTQKSRSGVPEPAQRACPNLGSATHPTT